MIDFLLGLILGGLSVFAFYHFKGESPAKIVSDLSTLEMRIQQMLSDAFNQAVSRLEQTVDAKIAAADTGSQVDAEATAAVNALADKFTAPAPAEG
jgi:hypothetical protein